jgi:iron complex outermembrane receptor protein
MNSKLRAGLCSAASMVAILAQADAGHAQGVARPNRPQSEPTDTVGEVIVTAQRREERLQDVPVSVTALTGRDLERQQLSDVQQLRGAVPSVYVGQALGDPTDIAIGIRGLAQTGAQSVTDPTVGVYVDGVYRARTSGSNVDFIDMERVEVLRGPQGTLFGRNTIGGAFNIVSKAPTKAFEGSVSADLGNYDTRNVTGILNLPLGDSLATRFVYEHAEHGGYANNVFLNKPMNDERLDYGRASVMWSPNADWNVLVSGDLLRVTGHAQALKTFYFNPAAAVGGVLIDAALPAANGHPGDLVSRHVNQGGYYDLNSEIDPHISIRTQDLTATVTGRLGSMNVKSITGLRREDAERPADLEDNPYPVIENPLKPFHYHQFSEELQAFGDLYKGRLTWIGGLYYFEEKDRSGQETVLLGNLAPVGTFGSLADTFAHNSSEGAFAQASWSFTPKWKLTGGLRYTQDTRSAVYFDQKLPVSGVGPVLCGLTWVDGPAGIQTGQLNKPVTAACQLSTPTRKFNYMPWTVGLDYKPTQDVLLYLKATKGFRSGGFLQGGSGIAAATSAVALVTLDGFNPENVISYEFGAKLELFEHRLRLNTALYEAHYSGIQQSAGTTVIVGGVPQNFFVTQNVGQAKIRGAEVEALALVGPFQVHGAFGYTDPRYTSGPLKTTPETPFINFSKTTYDLGVTTGKDLSFGRLSADLNYVYQSKVYFFVPGVQNAATWAAATQGGYGLLNGRVSMDFSGRPLTVAIWGRNLTKEQYHTRAADFSASPVQLISGTLGDPRTYGVTATYRF